MNGNEVTQESLVKRFHDHPEIDGCEQAALYKTGVLDAELLEAAGQHLHALNECWVVGVRFRAITHNYFSKKKEAVFEAYTANGRPLGSFFASAFVSLML